MDGIVILGHGSREAVDQANEFLEQVVVEIRKVFDTFRVEPAWMNPRSRRQNLRQAVARLVDQGVKRVIVGPVFLTDGLHMRKDIPEEVVVLKKEYPDVELQLARHFGFDLRLVAILTERIKEISNGVSG